MTDLNTDPWWGLTVCGRCGFLLSSVDGDSEGARDREGEIDTRPLSRLPSSCYGMI